MKLDYFEIYLSFLQWLLCVQPVITRSEWMDYFSGISASIEDDAYFSLMMRKCWGLK